MNHFSLKRRTLGKTVLALAFGISGLFSAVQAGAQCSSLGVRPRVARDTPTGILDFPSKMELTAAVYRPGSEQLIRVSDDNNRSRASIVGMWRFTFVSDGNAYPAHIPFGVQVDFGTQQWHDDGTEFIISGGRAPSSGDVCMGVWEKTGPRTPIG